MACEHPRIRREGETVEAMIVLYCRKNHHPKGSLCDECRSLLAYTDDRLTHCPNKERKPTCANCTIHCYSEPERSMIREVMRYSGPRMLLHHPVLALRHLIDRIAE
ncbi:MAG: nitrous oxide-stimulated promoter family protein [Candidatus Undinarchaeales archaeon]|jgi:hypothetical protein|nr:nitrous oxide-stimulated promoter family protein [Candidatus Undinarchaeales archaeon]MDP7492249.1 nitrous oxide-stimulated promoter family protein [Candidatus Undinarchaeales archaeon]